MRLRSVADEPCHDILLNNQLEWPPFVSVLILNYNGRHYLEKCLNSILATEYPDFEVLLIDNGSSDGSADYVRRNYPSVKIIENSNIGFAKAYNHAVKLTCAPYFVFLNNDVEVETNWLKELVQATSESKVAAATSKMRFFHERDRINSCGGCMDKFGFCVNRGIYEKDAGQYDDCLDVFYTVGAAMIVKRSAWRKVGQFDERYFAYFEDADWCWRARMLGYEVLYVPSSIVYHMWRGSWKDTERRMYFYERHRLSSILKNYSLKSLMLTLPPYFLLLILRILWIGKNWGGTLSLSMIRALFWNLINLPSTWKKRVKVQNARVISDKDITKKMIKGSLELTTMRRSAFLKQKR